jgi:hypothetical protein
MPLNTASLTRDLVFAFVGPWAFYAVGALWFTLTGGLTATKRRVLLGITIGFTLYCLVLTGRTEAETLKLLCLRSPFMWSLLFLVFVASFWEVHW